jgi:VCBS repeat-containing protein
VAGFNSSNTAPNGIISQTFATLAGQAYTLTFDVGVLSFNGNTSPQKMQVNVIGTSSLLSQNITLNGLGGGASIWAPQTFSFLANSASTTLTFGDQSATTSNTDLLLDNVRVFLGVNGPNTAPVAVANTYSTNVSTPLVVAAAGVLTNDTDAQSNPLTALLSTGPANGTLTLNANGGFTYTPTTSYTGPDSFTYRANDGSLDSNIVTVTINVNAVGPVTPVAFVNGSFESGLTGWTIGGSANTVLAKSDIAGTDGTTLAAFNSANTATNGVLSQTFATTPGLLYTVTFDMGVLAYNTSQQRIEVSAAGTGSLLSQIFTLNGINGGNVFWASKTASFTANNTSTTLTFSDRSTTGSGLDLLLDHVRVTSSAPPATGPFANGSFESGFTGWSVSGSANSILLNTVIPAPNGTTLAIFNSANSANNGVVTQTFATTAGTTYTVTFDMGVLAYNTSQQRLEVSAVGTGSLLSQTFARNGIGGGLVTWATQTVSFTANSASTILTFSDRSTTGSGLDLLLDYVRVTSAAAPSSIPAPPSTTAESEDLAAETAVTTVPANPGTLGSMSLNGTPGSFRVGMNAVETGLYILERSEDLKAWNYHSEIQVNEPGPIEFQDNETPSTHMFYRIGRQVEELRN